MGMGFERRMGMNPAEPSHTRTSPKQGEEVMWVEEEAGEEEGEEEVGWPASWLR
jgi:hypothetical protein